MSYEVIFTYVTEIEAESAAMAKGYAYAQLKDDVRKRAGALINDMTVDTVNKNGTCSECGRKYDDIGDCPCPSDDCPSHEVMWED